jgi:sensor c-di-GMP phosphodiesterase-like protein
MTPGDGFRMAANAGFGLQFTGRTASLTMTNNHFGAIVLSGTTAAQNITLPVASSASGEGGNAGALAVIINRSNQNWTIQTQSSQTFNGVAAKTSFTLPAGQMAWVVSDGTGYGGGLFALLP